MDAWMEPQLATLAREPFSDPAWIFERKLDGERCLAFVTAAGVRLMTRNRHEVTSTFPEITAALERQRHGVFVADGEIVAFSGPQTSFARLQRRLGVVRPPQALLDHVPVYYYLFDVLAAGGRDVRQDPLRDRKQLSRGLVGYADPLRFTEHRHGNGEAFFEQACRDGWEGIIAKRADAPYRGGRGRDWLKFKCENSQEFVVGGFTDPQGSRSGFGALLLGYHDPDGGLAYAGKVGTGFDTLTLRALRQSLSAMERPTPPFSRGRLPRVGVHWAEPRLVAQIAFAEWTADGQLRHPRFQGLRRDKDAAEVVREIPDPERSRP